MEQAIACSIEPVTRVLVVVGIPASTPSAVIIGTAVVGIIVVGRPAPGPIIIGTAAVVSRLVR